MKIVEIELKNTDRKIGKCQRGAAIVEFALVLPLLLLFLAGVIEFGRAFYTWSLMSEAIREGARAGIVELDNATAINVATQTTNQFLQNVNLTGGIVNASVVQISGINMLDVQASFLFQPFGLSGVIPTFTLQAKSFVRQEGQ